MALRVAVQADSKSNVGMENIPIGAAAARMGLNPSALRYYDERGLVPPAERRNGQRLYGHQELRRLALIKVMHGLGLSLDAARALLDEPPTVWRTAVREQTADLDQLIARAQGARRFLHHAQECPHDHPIPQCPAMIDTLDRIVGGLTLEELAAEHAGDDE